METENFNLKNPKEAKERLIVALDVATKAAARHLIPRVTAEDFEALEQNDAERQTKTVVLRILSFIRKPVIRGGKLLLPTLRTGNINLS